MTQCHIFFLFIILPANTILKTVIMFQIFVTLHYNILKFWIKRLLLTIFNELGIIIIILIFSIIIIIIWNIIILLFNLFQIIIQLNNFNKTINIIFFLLFWSLNFIPTFLLIYINLILITYKFLNLIRIPRIYFLLLFNFLFLIFTKWLVI